MHASLDPSRIDLDLDSRAVTFENPTGARGAGGAAHGSRKGAPSRRIESGEKVVLADLEGPGTIRHVWMTFPPARPERMRALVLEVFYDGAAEPSISVPALDFFGLPHGRPAPYVSALLSAQEGRGFNAYLPIPFRRRIKIELTNASPRPTVLYYQLDYTLERNLAPETGLLHVSFRRENPTRLKRDFTIAAGLRGPGRFLGCSVGVRTLPQKNFAWYGEGELKIFKDGDGALPTICGTGLEDYVGTAWGMGAHFALYGGVPLDLRAPESGPMPDFVELLPLARHGSGRVRARLARDDPADRLRRRPARRGGRPRVDVAHESGRRRGLVARQPAPARARDRRAGRRLLRLRVRVLPRRAAGAAARPGAGLRGHRAPAVRVAAADRDLDGDGGRDLAAL